VWEKQRASRKELKKNVTVVIKRVTCRPTMKVFGPGNGSSMATNVVVVVVLVVTSFCYQIFNVLKLFHPATYHNETSATG